MRVSADDLREGQTVWYRYGGYSAVGPCTVDRVSRGYNGKTVHLYFEGQLRTVDLSDDPDFGAPVFHDSNPEKDIK